MSEADILASFLNVPVDMIQGWSDGTFTVGNDDSREYKVTKRSYWIGIIVEKALDILSFADQGPILYYGQPMGLLLGEFARD